jgi:hypothetical protein
VSFLSTILKFYSEIAVSRKPFRIGHMYIHTFLLRTTNTMTFQNTEVSSWGTLYKSYPKADPQITMVQGRPRKTDNKQKHTSICAEAIQQHQQTIGTVQHIIHTPTNLQDMWYSQYSYGKPWILKIQKSRNHMWMQGHQYWWDRPHASRMHEGAPEWAPNLPSGILSGGEHLVN